MNRFVTACVLVVACGCGESFTSFGGPAEDGGGGGGGGAEGGSGGSTASGPLHLPVGAGGGVGDCPAPDGWQSVAVGCDDPGLVLGLEANEAECGECECDAWSGNCAVVESTLQCWPASQGSCPGTPPWDSDGSETCQAGPPAIGEFHNCKLAENAPADGACEPSGGGLVDPSPWETTVDLCDGCGCFARKGDHDCPEADMVRTVGYASVVDERGCSACSCSGAGSCVSKAVISNDCGGQIALVETSCVGVNYQASWVFNVEATAPVSCEVGGGEGTGSVSPEDPWTVCCPDL